MRSQAATCLFETPRRAEATVFPTRPSLKEGNVDLSFYEVLYASLTLVNKHIYTRRAKIPSVPLTITWRHVKNLLKIYRHKVEQRARVIETLLDIDNRCDYTEKQKGVLKADVLEIFDEVYEEVPRRDEINEFIKAAVNCVSPKTKKKAKELIKKHSL